MDNASISQGSHVTSRPRGLALKNPASCSLSLRVTYRVAPIPGVLTARSVMMHNSSSGRGREVGRLPQRADWAQWKDVSRSSDYSIPLWDWRPATTVSSGDNKAEYWGITRARTLYATTMDFTRPTVSGLLQDARVAIRFREAWRVPESQIQPNIKVDLGLMTVLKAESLRLHLERARSTRFQWCSNSFGESAPQYRSSAILATTPSWMRTPSARHMSSSKAVCESGMPIAEPAYTRTPQNGVGTPQYFIDSRARGIW